MATKLTKCIQSNINNNNGNIFVRSSPTLSSSLDSFEDLYDDESDEEKKVALETIYGLNGEINTYLLSWPRIISNYRYNKEEIVGSKKLQSKLAELFNISSLLAIDKYFPPFECIRYYCGCSMDIDRGIKKWIHSIKMYKQYKMHNITENELVSCFKTLSKSIAFGGYDCDGCRIITIKYSLFYFNEYKNLNIFLLAGFYLFYYLTHDVDAHRNGVCLLCDLTGFSLSNFSFTVEKNGIQFFQKVLPIRIKKVFVVNAPWIAHYALKLVLPLLNEKIRKRVFIVTKEELYTISAYNGNGGENTETNKTIMDEKNLPTLVGGTFDDEYMNDNNQSFFYFVLLNYFKKTINLNHFNVDFNVD